MSERQKTALESAKYHILSNNLNLGFVPGFQVSESEVISIVYF